VERHHSGGKFERLAAYCRAVRAGPLIVVSGCAPIDETGALIAPGDVRGQTAAAIEIALDAVDALGGQPESVIRSRVFLASGVDWRGAVEAHAEAFRNIDPANTTLYVQGFIPDGVLVEVELDALIE
jgi:enamine deaminase RidA (YjgF/YER057c/UK114 family)